MRSKVGLAALVAVVIAVVVFAWRRRAAEETRATLQTSATVPAGRAAPWTLARAIDEAGDYLVRVDGEDGRFAYRVHADGKRSEARKYNILRHAGSIYALAEYRARAPNEEARSRVDAAIQRSSAYVVKRYVRPVKDR